jgi:hypothetical protein
MYMLATVLAFTMDTVRANSNDVIDVECVVHVNNTGAFSTGQSKSIKAVVLTGASLSVLGSSFIIFTYWYLPKLRSFPYKLIAYLSLADWFSSFAYILGADNDADECVNTVICGLTAAMSQFFDVATFLWTAVIAFNIYCVLVQGKGPEIRRYEKYYHMVAWGIPMVLLIVVAATGSLGDAGNWCWITEDHQIERVLCYYVPLMLIMIVNGVIYVLIGRAVSDTLEASTINRRLRLYILVFVFIRLWSVINRFQNWVNPTEPVYALYLLHSLFSPLQGFLNSIVYGFNKKVISTWRNKLNDLGLLSAVFGACCKRGSAQTNAAASGNRRANSSGDAEDNQLTTGRV